ncbi:hypothetical protein TTHERM_00309870 (macronuclear) [Tetrahymena thermophila SB210]|uniref:Uncharacterized protein n=1 Tax=Tetrahymena thermophila (strain SB210) TaxID=312017 RepID=I7MFZ2_TETTS|nr:hypothetical protein TTHERM_00309870 [Tetrahymena thermophila SB210]EAS00818.2 hypothetical protein TTHERM_00309870 [Tetrahymena thermophila SB210]|eukprot:XP_001021063.2 hypothetical protein TTHERM_00309870 [Tetrahymena thermophila SB210]
MSDKGVINPDFIRQTVQDEQYYWNNIEVICQSVLGDKKKETYAPILQVVQEVLVDDGQSGVVKLLTIRLLGTLVYPQSAQFEQYQTNTNFVSRLLKSNDILNVLYEICLYKAEVQDDNRGESMFKSEGKEIGKEFLKYCLEFVRFLATTWENSKTNSGDIVQTQFSIIYQNLQQSGVKFPDKNSYFGEIKKKKSSKTQQSQAATQQPSSKVQKQAAGDSASDKLIADCLSHVEPLLNMVNSNASIIPAIQDKIENDQVIYVSYVQKLQESMEDAKDFETLWAFLEFFNELTQEIEKIKQNNYSKKAYISFRKRVLEVAQQKLEKFWQPSSAQAQAQSVAESQKQPEKVKQVEQSQKQQPQETNTGGGGGFDNWGGDFNQGFDFNAQNQGGGGGFDFNAQNQAGGFGFDGGFQNFNFEEQKKAEELEEQTRLQKIQQEQQSQVQKQQEESKDQQKQSQKNNNFFDQEQHELDKQFNKGGFDQGFGNNFDNGGFGDFGNNNDQGFGGNFGQNNQGFGNEFEQNNQGFGNEFGKNDQGFGNEFGQHDQGFGNEFGTFQEKHQNKDANNFDQGFGGFWDNNQQQEPNRKQSQDKSPQFTNNQFFDNQDTIKERPPAQPNNQDFTGFGGFGDPQQSQNQQGFQNQNQTMKKQQQNNRASPQNQNQNTFYNFDGSGDKSHSYAYNMQQNQDNRRGDFRDSFVEFSELSKSDISARDFPLRNTIINVKEVRGTLHTFNKETFQVLQDYNVTQQIVRRFKIANLKVKSPLIESQDFQVGVISERIFDQNSSRYLIKCDLFFGNKTSYNVENFNIEFEGDYTSHLYIKNDKFPDIIEPKKQYKLNSMLSYTKTPYSLINANVQGTINGNEFYFTIFVPNLLPRYVHFYEPSNNMLYFRQKWRQKRDQIIKSDQFALNKRVIRTPIYFKRYFPQFSENMSLDDFIYHNKSNTNVLNYKLRGTVELDIPSIEYMVKFIVRPNFTAVIQVIPYSGYLNTAKALIDHFVFIFGQQ